MSAGTSPALDADVAAILLKKGHILLLGLLAGLLSFIPNIGPILALVPAVLIALISGPDDVLYVVLLYSGVQAFESYLLTPLLQKRMVDLPPALTIAMQFLFGVLAGGLGQMTATTIKVGVPSLRYCLEYPAATKNQVTEFLLAFPMADGMHCKYAMPFNVSMCRAFSNGLEA